MDGNEMAVGADTPRQQDDLEQGILFLAGRCDGARMRDGTGYNGTDASFGHSLAEQIAQGRPLTAKQRRASWRMLRKYSGQLRSGGIDYAAIPTPPSEEEVTAAQLAASPQVKPKADANAVRLTVEDDRIVARTPYRLKDVCKGIPGRRWTPQVKPKGAWTYPAEPTSALNLRTAFLRETIRTDDAFEALLAEADRMRAASVHKTAEELDPVPITKTDAWRHQRQAYWFAAEQRAAMLAMDMGTGKSKVVIDLIVNNDAEDVLIMCPLKVVGVWPKQFRLHAGVPCHVEIGPVNSEGKPAGSVAQKVEAFRKALDDCRCGRPHVCVVNYEASAFSPFKEWVVSREWDYFIMDESHRIKAPNGVWSKLCSKVSKHARRRLALTGTPMPQSPLDIYAQYRALDPGIFGTSYTSFLHRFAIMGGYQGHEVMGYVNQDELNERFYSIAYRVGAEVLDLPPANDVERACFLGAPARRIYSSLEKELYATVPIDGLEELTDEEREMLEDEGDEISAPNVLVKMLRLQQITGGSVGTDGKTLREVDTSKVDLLTDEVSDMPAATEPIVVFCRFIHDLDMVRRAAGKLGVGYGELSGRQSDLTADSTIPEYFTGLFAVQMQSGGVGVDFTASRYGIYYSLGFSLGDYLQSRARLVRPGQEHPVLFTHLICAGTIDEKVYAALRERKKVVDFVLQELGIAA